MPAKIAVGGSFTSYTYSFYEMQPENRYNAPDASRIGWYYMDNGIPVEYDFSRPVHESLKLHAKWEALDRNQVLVQWNPDGGTPRLDGQVLERGQAVNAPKQTPHRLGYTFAGWMVDGHQVSFPFTVSESTVFVANWRRKEKPAGGSKRAPGKDGSVGTPVATASASPLRIVPNPVHDAIMLKGIQAPTPLQVYSLGGRMVKACTAEPGLRIDLGGLPAGIYLVRTPAQTLRFV